MTQQVNIASSVHRETDEVRKKYSDQKSSVTDINRSKIYYDPKIVAKTLPKLTLLCRLVHTD